MTPVYVESPAAVPESEAPATTAPPAKPTIDEGTWTVGQDVPAGKYSTDGAAGSDCYWEIAKSGSNGRDIISNHLGGGHLTVVLKSGQDFTTESCGIWTKVG